MHACRFSADVIADTEGCAGVLYIQTRDRVLT